MAEIILPGSKIISGIIKADGTYIEGDSTYASVVGIFDEEKRHFIPLEGLWYPKEGDRVVGTIVTRRISAYIVDLNSPYKGIIMTKFEHSRLEEGDIIEATVREFKEFDDAMVVVLTRPKRLFGGVLLNIKPTKVPRVIGKGNTMIDQITQATKCSIIVGLNGTVWLKGGDINLATEAIKTIELQAHVSGLTDKIKNMLEKKGK
ncbi:MAG: KH domain-containing protein [Candidatus Micrarchaeia archaeon]|jgi:exosome complex component RRP4